MRRNINSIVSTLFLFLSFMATGQNEKENFYYYQGEKVYLEVNTDYAYLVIDPKGSTTDMAQLGVYLGAGIEVMKYSESNVSRTLKTEKFSVNAGTSTEYWAEVKLDKSRSYDSHIKRLEENASVIQLAPYFKNEANDKIGLSHYFYVKLKAENDVERLREFAADTQTEIVGQNRFMPRWYTLRCKASSIHNALEAANIFYESGFFLAAEPDLMVDDLPNYVPNDPLYNNQWGLDNDGQYGGTVGVDIHAEDAWDITLGDPNVVVAVLDHGFEMNHPDLAANTFGTGFDSESGTSPARVLGPHGTACAGIVGAVQGNNLGVSGVAPNSSLMSVSNSLAGSPNSRQRRADGINWAWQNGAAVISNSWSSGVRYTIIDDAIDNALANGRGGLGTVIVFATGNNNSTVSYPADSDPDIIAVGAMSPCGERKNPGSCDGESWGSNFGSQLDVIAPGVLIPTTDRQGDVFPNACSPSIGDYNPSDCRTDDYPDRNYTRWFNGTSSACPHVAGVAALVLSVNPGLTVREVNDIIEQSAQKVGGYTYSTTAGRPNGTWNNEVGYGLVDAHAAVLLAADCQDHLTITANVPAGATDNREAALTITATNVIASAGTAVYHAANAVMLSPGFHAQNGADFHTYNEGCTGNFNAITRASPVAAGGTERADKAEESLSRPGDFVNGELVLYPNPADQSLSVQLGDGNAYTMTVYDHLGHRLIEGSLTEAEGSLDISHLPAGTYFIEVVNDETGKAGKGKFMVVR